MYISNLINSNNINICQIFVACSLPSSNRPYPHLPFSTLPYPFHPFSTLLSPPHAPSLRSLRSSRLHALPAVTLTLPLRLLTWTAITSPTIRQNEMNMISSYTVVTRFLRPFEWGLAWSLFPTQFCRLKRRFLGGRRRSRKQRFMWTFKDQIDQCDPLRRFRKKSKKRGY